MDYAIVVAAEVTNGDGPLAEEPITVATLRGPEGGHEHVVRIVGGPTKRGGFARLAGYVVPMAGARVRLDLREDASVPLAVLAPASFGQSWVPNDPAGTWAAGSLPLVFDVVLPGSRDLGPLAATELDVAARTWGRPACTAFRARYGDSKALISKDDGDNGVFFHDDLWPDALVPGAIAQTIVHVDGAGRLHDADIHVNGADYRFSTDGASGTQDARSILVHEIGHALGLGHSSDPRATMFVSGSGLRWRSLESDDVTGVCALYPGTGGATCEESPCPSGYLCVAGACQRPADRADVCSPCTPEVGACEAAGDDARCIDLRAGASGGRACGRSCATQGDCGTGFACLPTTEAGDLQCVSLDGCKNGANVCATDADCKQSPSTCRDGACLGPPAALPVADGGADAGAAEAVRGRGSSCVCQSAAQRRSYAPEMLGLVLAAAALYGRRRR